MTKCEWCNAVVYSWCTTDTANGARWLCERHAMETSRDMYYDRLEKICSRNMLITKIIRTYREG